MADVFDALTSKRPYKEAFSNEKSLKIMKEKRGTHFDPKIVDLFMGNLTEVFEIQEKYKTVDSLTKEGVPVHFGWHKIIDVKGLSMVSDVAQEARSGDELPSG